MVLYYIGIEDAIPVDDIIAHVIRSGNLVYAPRIEKVHSIERKEYESREFNYIIEDLTRAWFLSQGVPPHIIRKWIFSSTSYGVEIHKISRTATYSSWKLKIPMDIFNGKLPREPFVFKGYVNVFLDVKEPYESILPYQKAVDIKSFSCMFEVASSLLPKKYPRKFLGYLDDIATNSADLVYDMVFDWEILPIAIEVRFIGRTPSGIVLIHTDEGTFFVKVTTEYIGEEDVKEFKEIYGWNEKLAEKYAITDSTLAIIGAFDFINKSDISKEEFVERHLLTPEDLIEIRRTYNDFTVLVFTYLPYIIKE